jgi:tetratricopeptide (TPR) repeat protein
LTDSTIARHPEEPIPGMALTWKEKKHNSRYILSNEPDYIVFSTDMKPSAPAERALLVYRQFVESYRAVGWEYNDPVYSAREDFLIAFKKIRPLNGEIIPFYPIEYVEYYKKGIDASIDNDYRTALGYCKKALEISPQPYNSVLLYYTGVSLAMTGEDTAARNMLETVLRQDSLSFLAHRSLYLYAAIENDYERMKLHKRWMQKIAPWYVKKLESYVN